MNKDKTPVVRIETMTGWPWAKRAALRTVGKKPKDPEPSTEWKLQALIAEHSPIKLVQLWIDIDNLRQWVGVHLIRHQYMLPFISSQRSDRSDNPDAVAEEVLSMIKDDIVNDPDFDRSQWRDYRTQGSTNDHTFVVNAQTLINISRKRLCGCASKETREVWTMVREAIRTEHPEIAEAMVPNCIYRGFCPENTCCGYVLGPKFQRDLEHYRSLIKPADQRLMK